MTTMEEVIQMMPLVTEFTLASETAASYFDLASGAVTGLSGKDETLGYCYYIAHLLSQKTAEIASEHLGSYSVTYSGKSYLALLQRLQRKSRLNAIASFAGTHADAKTMERYTVDDMIVGGVSHERRV